MIDPTTIRLSPHFLLSDMIGCHSCYSKGLPNVFDGNLNNLNEGRFLCDTILEPLLEKYGPLSISYGYLSPELSRQIVKYQDPNLPSYHRWDKGAAVDICVHSWVKESAPIYLANEIDATLPYSRLITYSESPYICVATQLNESVPRRAFYENRYCGKKGAKPLYIKKGRDKKVTLEFDWKGAGYPTYHGGGIRQSQHIRCGENCMVSDFLYSTKGLWEGIKNLPNPSEHRRAFGAVGKIYDTVLGLLGVPRLSITRGFESFRFDPSPYQWGERFALDFKPPTYIQPKDILVLSSLGIGVSFDKALEVVTISGRLV